MPSKHTRRHAATGLCDKRLVQRGPDMVDRLAFKYMEMCKVDSSSDSESDTSPRWSDASIKSFQGCTGPKRPSLPKKSLGRQFPQPLDPYDGSSEDSSSSADAPKRQKHGGLRTKGRGRRPATIPLPLLKEVRRVVPRDSAALLHLTDVQMKSSSDSELKAINQGHQLPFRARKCANAVISENIEYPFSTESSLPLADEVTESSTHPGTPPPSLFFSKRKLFCPSGDAEELMHRKKQCISQMEMETIYTEG